MLSDWTRSRRMLHHELELTRRGSTYLMRAIQGSGDMALKHKVEENLRKVMMTDTVFMTESQVKPDGIWFVELLVRHFHRAVKKYGGPNFVTFGYAVKGEEENMEVTVRRKKGLTTGEVIAELRKKIRELEGTTDAAVEPFTL